MRCSSPEDAALALKAARTLRRHRAARQMHEPFKGHTARVLLQVRARGVGWGWAPGGCLAWVVV